MGMFDDVVLTDDSVSLRCGQGHNLKRFQTKDLDCNMDSYYIYNKKIYHQNRSSQNAKEPSLKDGILVLTNHDFCEPVLLNTTINVYNHCDECDPIYTDDDLTSRWGNNGRSPWVEYDLVVSNGEVQNAISVKVQTRNDVRAEMVTNQLIPLPDDDRHVQKMLKTRGKQGY